MSKYKFNISMDADVIIEAENKLEARQKVIELMDRGEYNNLLIPDASAYVDDGLQLKEKEQ
jgi:hypothetical protein